MNAIVPVRDGAKALIEEIGADLQSALPATIPYERFKATFITAVAHNPDILTCDPQSVKTALMKSAIDNLMPDNREAAIVPFNTKVKGDDGRDQWVKLAQYMPMVQGIRKRALELGGARIISEVVYENDHFDAVMGDDPRIEHKAVALGKPRGQIIGAYAVFKDEDGNILHREVMPKEDIEAARNVSRAKDGPGWKNFYGEFARKTVVRRGAKSIPNIPDKLRTIIERDDDYVDFDQVDTKSSKTIDYNPLVEGGRQIENKNTEAQSASPDKQTMGGRKDDESPASAKPASTDAGGPGNADTGTRAQENSASDDAPDAGGESREGEAQSATAPMLSREVFETFSGALARVKSVENLQKAKDEFFKGKGMRPNEAETKLFQQIFNAHKDRITAGQDVGKVMAEIQAWIVEDVPEEKI